MKKVLLVVIDALAARVVRPAMEQGGMPHMRELVDAGQVRWDCTAIFPSITPAATAALVTGQYPCATGIAGAYFYDQAADRVHYYGDDTWAIIRRGIATYFQDFLVRLNRDRLRVETAFEIVEHAGKRSACLNYLWFRGDVPHRVGVPWLLRLWPGIPFSETVAGPSLLSLGDFVSDSLASSGSRLKGPGGVFRRFGFTDAATAAELLMLAKQRALPDFTVAYFPDNDFDSHTDGPQASLSTVEKVDHVLGQMAEAYGGLQSLLSEVAIVITGDHAQSDLPLKQQNTGVLLNQVLKDYSIVPAGEPWGDGHELMICPNMRAAQVYLRPDYWVQRDAIVQRLLEDERIDQVIWREDDAPQGLRYCVRTQRHGLLAFGPEAAGPRSARDEYGVTWGWQGNLAAVDARVSPEDVLTYGDYPNALERIATAFDDQVSGDLWLTSRLGYEFRLDGTSVHRRGSHGSLHAEDSLSPLILAGVPEELFPKQTPRSVDIAPLCLSLLGLQGSHRVGASRAGTIWQSVPG